MNADQKFSTRVPLNCEGFSLISCYVERGRPGRYRCELSGAAVNRDLHAGC